MMASYEAQNSIARINMGFMPTPSSLIRATHAQFCRARGEKRATDVAEQTDNFSVSAQKNEKKS